MIIFGIKEKIKQGDTVLANFCSACGHTAHTAFGVTKYFHLFWIPTFIISRNVILVCEKCGKNADSDNLNAQQEDAVRGKLFSILKAFPFFTGSIIILLLAALVAFATHETENNTLQRLNSPRINDLYSIDLSKIIPDFDFGNYKYGIIRVTAFTNKEITFSLSAFSYKKKLTLTHDVMSGGADDESYYGKTTLIIGKKHLVDLLNSDVIAPLFPSRIQDRKSKRVFQLKAPVIRVPQE